VLRRVGNQFADPAPEASAEEFEVHEGDDGAMPHDSSGGADRGLVHCGDLTRFLVPLRERPRVLEPERVAQCWSRLPRPDEEPERS
jgi:hypothetical protein